jgi:ERCC4-type nuclease
MYARATIVADSREQNGAIPFLESCVAENNRNHSHLPINGGGGELQYLEKQLTIGDYCILLPGNILAAVIERKTWKDLAASLKDGRCRSQHERLEEIKTQKQCQVFYIIEGSMSYTDAYLIGGIPFKNLHAKVIHNLLRGYPYLQTKDAQSTAKLLTDLARAILKMSAQGELTFSATEESESSSTTGGVDGEITIPDELKTRKVHGDADIIIAMWCTLPGVSDKTASILMKHYKISEVIAASNHRVKTLIEEISELKYASGAKIGEAKAKKIMGVAKLEQAQLMGAKLLACIPTISVEKAETILDVYTLRDLCSGTIPADDVAEIKHKNRKIGINAAERMLDTLRQKVEL